MARKPHPDANARVFDTVKKAEAHAKRLRAKDSLHYTERNLAVLSHPRKRGKYVLGRMAGGFLLFGYVS